MKALQCVELAGPEKLVFSEVDDPKPGSGQVLLEIKAASVNFPDVLMIQGLYQNQPPMPFIPGAECSGVISEIGEGVDSCSVGDHVFVMAGTGCFAEKLVVDAASVTLIPKAMDFPVAAALPMTYGTSLYSLKQRANLQPGETLLVLGAAGGVGLSAVEIGKAMGARVIATASTDEKCNVAKDHGADEIINYSNGEFKDTVKSMTDGKGADVIYDPVGGDVFDQSLRCISWEGRLLVIGFTSGRIPSAPANLALLKSCDIVGVFWGAFVERTPKINLQNFEKLYQWIEEGYIKPRISMKVTLKNTLDAMQAIADRKIIGKAIVKI